MFKWLFDTTKIKQDIEDLRIICNSLRRELDDLRIDIHNAKKKKYLKIQAEDGGGDKPAEIPVILPESEIYKKSKFSMY